MGRHVPKESYSEKAIVINIVHASAAFLLAAEPLAHTLTYCSGRQVSPWTSQSGLGQVYDFIIFRGQDIKDLTVLESGKQPGAAALQQNRDVSRSDVEVPAGVDHPIEM